MRNYDFTNNGKHYTRIDKRTARRAFDNGLTVVFCPCNLHPFGFWNCGVEINKSHESFSGYTFDNIVNHFEYYNCINAETGKYSAFYAVV